MLALLEADAGAFGHARRIEQQDRAAVVGERGAGIEAGGHHRRRGRLDHQFLMIVDRIDGERIDVAAGGLEQDQLLLVARRVARRRRAASARPTSGTRRPRTVATSASPTASMRTAPPPTRRISSIAERGMAKHLAAGADRQRRDDGERQRHADGEPDALTRRGCRRRRRRRSARYWRGPRPCRRRGRKWR